MQHSDTRGLELKSRPGDRAGAKPRGAGALLLVTAATGLGGMLGQLLLLREMLVSFYGNELTMGIVLANWLLLEAAGALAGGRKAASLRFALPCYVILLLLYALLLPAALFFSRGAQLLFFSPLPGETLGLAPLYFSSLLIIAPPAFVHGALFPRGCSILAHFTGESTSIGRIYLYETIGTLAGGVLFTLFLAERFHSLELALALSILHLLGGFFLLFFFPAAAAGSRVLLQGTALAAALLLIIYFPAVSDFLHLRSLQRQWRGQEVVHYENSPYGNIVALHSGSEYTFFYNGRPVITVPLPDTALIADFVHIIAAAHPQPREVLLVASGLGGVLDEILRHPVEEVLYLELDPRLPEVVAAFPTPLTERELGDPRVTVEHVDGRLYLARTGREFDLIVLGFIIPETIQSNRLYTGEFFSLAAKRLSEEGILAFSLPGSPVYLSPEMIALNGSLYRTLLEHFEHVQAIPGEVNIFLASGQPLELSPSLLEKRLVERGLGDGFLSGAYLQYRLDPYRVRWLREILQGSEARLNFDLNPASFFYALLYWSSTFSPGILRFLAAVESLELWHYLVPILAVTGLLLVVMARDRKRRKRPLALGWAVFTSGSAGMAFDLLVLFVFQCLYGFVYQMVGLLVASFMAGTFLGGAWGLRRTASQAAAGLFCFLEAGVAALIFSFFPFTLLLQLLVTRAPGELLFALFAAFALLSGFAVGAQFPLAAALYSPGEERTGEVAGTLYTADLLGGWSAGLLLSVVLFPLLGLWQTLLLLGIMKAGSFALFAYSCRAGRAA